MSEKFAVITGASTGIGYELAKCCAKDGYDMLLCADEPSIEDAAHRISQLGVKAESLQCDLGTEQGVSTLWETIRNRRIDVFMANAGKGLGEGFLDQDFAEAKRVIDINITGTVSILHKVGNKMRDGQGGRILITGSVAGFIPGAFQAVYNGTKAFLDSFAEALRNEWKDLPITVTCLMPGPTETEFFDRAEMQNTPVGKSDKDDAAMVARSGYDALMSGKGAVASGFMNKVQTTFAGIIPDSVLAQMHRKMAEPETH